jgi:hypothetical protein
MTTSHSLSAKVDNHFADKRRSRTQTTEFSFPEYIQCILSGHAATAGSPLDINTAVDTKPLNNLRIPEYITFLTYIKGTAGQNIS